MADIVEVRQGPGDEAAGKRRVLRVSQAAASGAAAILLTVTSCSVARLGAPFPEFLVGTGAASVGFGLVTFAINYFVRVKSLYRNVIINVEFQLQNDRALSVGVDSRWLEAMLKTLTSFGVKTDSSVERRQV